MKKRSVKSYWSVLSPYLLKYKGQFTLLVMLLLGGIGLQILSPRIMGQFVDAARSGNAGNRLLYLSLSFVAVALVQQAVTVGTTYTGENIAWKSTNLLRRDLTRHSLNLDLSFHNRMSPGKMIERIDSDVGALAQFFSQIVVLVVGNILLLAGILIVLTVRDPRLGLTFLLFTLCTAFLLIRVRNIAVPTQKATMEKDAEFIGYLEERLSGTEEIRANGAVQHVLNGIDRFEGQILKLALKRNLLGMVVYVITDIMMAGGYVLTIILGERLYREGVLTTGGLFQVGIYIGLLGRPLVTLTQQMEALQNVKAAVARITQLKGETSALDSGGISIPEAGKAFDLELKNLCFSYDQGVPVLKDLDLHLKPGRKLGILGRTGSGKSTMARLVFRFYDPDKGTITLDGKTLTDYNLKALRSRIAYISQEVQLFQGTLRDNLTFFDKSIPDAKIIDSLNQLGLEEWYTSLAEGLDTPVETGGKGLSAGEAQLLALTRVFLKDPGLVIMDEASSRLDPATEKRLDRVLERVLKGRTSLIIAHRLGTVRKADDILIIEDGRSIEHGPRENLAADADSRFNALLSAGMEEVLV